MSSMHSCWIMHCARYISPIQTTISIGLVFYADETTFCDLPWPTLNPMLYHLQGACDAFIQYVTVWSFPLILMSMSRQNCFHQVARRRTLLCCKVIFLPLTELSCGTNEISRSIMQTAFVLSVKSVEIASKNFYSFLRFSYSDHNNILTL